jgi:hypothetical protein
MIPVVTIAYGGGPGTLDTMVEAMESGNPIIAVKGSGRAVDLVIDWRAFVERIAAASEENKQNLLVEQRARGAREYGENLPNFTDKLDRLAASSHIYIFDFVKEGQKLAKKEGNSNSKNQNTLLPVLLQSIFESPSVNAKAKFPLAIRYNVRSDAKKILDKQGLNMIASAEKEICADGRMLIFAAYNDYSHIVEEMIDAGFNLSQLDHLIDLELRQDQQIRTLPKLLTK